MADKLVRNTSDRESREWWKAVHEAAVAAPTLTFDERNRRTSEPPRQASRRANGQKQR